jgi:hypothetical protein
LCAWSTTASANHEPHPEEAAERGRLEDGSVIPVQAGIQREERHQNWIPAFAGMTSEWQPLTFPTTIRKPTGAALI